MIKNHRNIDLLPLDCGVKKFPETETQWLVVITDQYGSFQCTGALITYHHMLFPASCLSKVDNVNRINLPPTPFTFHHLHQTIYSMFFLFCSTKYILVKMIVGRRTTVNQENHSMSRKVWCYYIHNMIQPAIKMILQSFN